MADRSVSVPMTLSDLERPDARNQFFFRRILITLVRSSHVIAFAQMRRAVCQRQLSFLFFFCGNLDKMRLPCVCINVSDSNVCKQNCEHSLNLGLSKYRELRKVHVQSHKARHG